MISVNQNVTDAFKKSYSLNSGVGAVMDINCNTLINFTDDDLSGNASQIVADKEPFKKLFPLDTVVKTFRPYKSGIKYAISGDVSAFSWTNPRDIDYLPKLPNGNIISYRTYYPSKDVYYKYFITPLNENANITIRYYTNSQPVSDKNKTVPCNKVVIKFEIGHATPTSWSILINGSDVSSSLSKTVPSTGVVEIYYTGSGWSRNEADLNLNSTVTIQTLGLTAVNPGGYIGVIELAPHWVKDLTPNIVSATISKETSSSSEDILPVGNLTANSLDISLNGYNQDGMIFKTYTKYSTEDIDTDLFYFSKNAEIKPYFKLYNDQGDNQDSSGKYYKIPQGVFILDNWAFSEYGEATVFALDSAKILQETLCPDILCDNYSAIAIIRRVLDSVGFTNYNFNYTSTDQSVITPQYWWSDSSKTVWNILQELCRDTQMSASVDENNILQFYTRDYMFDDSKEISWSFSNETDLSGNLPNIVSMEIKELPSVNNVRILYSSAYITTYEQSAKELVSIDNTLLSSSSLTKTLPLASNENKTSWTEDQKWVSIKPIFITESEAEQISPILSNYSGYLLINSEVIEYDAIEFEYITAINDTIDGQSYSAGQKVRVAISSDNDIAKYRGKAQIVFDSTASSRIVAFTPTGRYRIKSRGAFKTKPSSHVASINYEKNGWSGYSQVTWRNK